MTKEEFEEADRIFDAINFEYFYTMYNVNTELKNNREKFIERYGNFPFVYMSNKTRTCFYKTFPTIKHWKIRIVKHDT